MLMDLTELLAESDKVYTGAFGQRYRVPESYVPTPADDGSFDASKFGVDPRDPPKTTMPADDGWIEWKGGENPMPGKRVDYKLRNKVEHYNCTANHLDWGWIGQRGTSFPMRTEAEIIRYRIVGDTP